MKKVSIIVLATIISCSTLFYSFTLINNTSVNVEASKEVVFRKNQYLYERGNEGNKIYLYSSGKCQMYEDDYLKVETTYDYYPETKEVHILLENGRTFVTGRVTLKADRQNISYIDLRGTRYYSK